MLLTTGAIVLLGLTVLTVNRMYGTQGDILRQSEIGIYAISTATSMLEEASGLSFDEATVDNSITNTANLTTAASLGPESGERTSPESTTLFDDFDDFHNLRMGVGISGVDSFTVRGTISYVPDTAPDVPTTTRTWFKRLDVAVSSWGMRDTIKLSYVFSYFNFR